MKAEEEFVIVLFSYRRPVLTRAGIERILQWKEDANLLISIDGFRKNGTKCEFDSWKETIKVANEYSANFANVRVFSWQVNNGLTAHAKRIFPIALKISNCIVSLEEDYQISDEGLDFLTQSSSGVTFARSAYTSTYHSFNQCVPSLQTFFPQQWATSYSGNIIEAFLALCEEQKISRKAIAVAMRTIPNPLTRLLLVELWYEHLHNCLVHPSYGDALIQYCAWLYSTPFEVPLTSYVEDLAHLEIGGINKRLSRAEVQRHELDSENKPNSFCSVCELERASIFTNPLRTVLGSKKNRLLTFLRFSFYKTTNV